MEFLIAGAVMVGIAFLSARGKNAEKPAEVFPKVKEQVPIPPPQIQTGDNGVMGIASDVVKDVKTGVALFGTASAVVGAAEAGLDALGVTGGAAISIPAAETAAAASGTAATGTSIGAAFAAAPATAAVAVVAAAAVVFVIGNNVRMMFQSLFGTEIPAEPVRRAALNIQMGALYNTPVLAGKLSVPLTVTNADDSAQVAAAGQWITYGHQLLVEYGKDNEYTSLQMQALLRASDQFPTPTNYIEDMGGAGDRRLEP